MAEPADPLFGGLTVSDWFTIFDNTHCILGFGGIIRLEWPEDGGYGDQPVCVTEAIDLIREAVMKEMKNVSQQ